ncbi:MAG: hypothetical protein AABZ22_01510, partial [Nitrospirota bacterium]
MRCGEWLRGAQGGVMAETKDFSGKVNIDQELLAILCCPETKQDVALADDALIARLNDRIAKRELKNKAGQPVSERLDGGLIRADKKFLYPIREDIPVMLIEEGIPIEGLA